MKPKHALCLVAAVLSCGLTLAGGDREVGLSGDRLTYELSDLDGNPVTSTDERFAGKVRLVTVWGTWCPPCLTEIPTLNDLQARYGDQGLVVVAIALEHGEAASRRKFLRSFVRDQGIDYLVLDGGTPDDITAALPAIISARGLPIEFLIDRTGKVAVARHGYGYKKKWARQLEQEIAGLLAQPTQTD